jgi:hypothetical protein
MSRRPRVYLAIGTFYEPQRLSAATDSLLAWGFAPNRLWKVVPACVDAPAPGRLAENDPQCRFELRMLPPEMLDGAHRDGGDEGTDLSGLCLNAIMASNAGTDIERHVEKGATVLVAGTEGADLHDQCVKVLLRYSLHTVHTQEVGVSA